LRLDWQGGDRGQQNCQQTSLPKSPGYLGCHFRSSLLLVEGCLLRQFDARRKTKVTIGSLSR
jgi:hypothetical protein